MYYSVSQYLVQQGYIVLTPDYRGSSGYTRDWTTGVHMKVGVADADDVASGADYLKTLSYIDPDRVGVWGLSYGGFLTLQVLTRNPTLFRAGINVAGVVDWTYRGAGMTIAGYTIPRLGTPIENPAVPESSGKSKWHAVQLISPGAFVNPAGGPPLVARLTRLTGPIAASARMIPAKTRARYGGVGT